MAEERRVSITSSSHLTPEDVSRHTFGTARRGFEPGEVRAYLESIAIELRAIAERENELLQKLADAEHRAAHPVLDEATLAAAVGSETARVLHSAHEAAAEVEARAEGEAERLLAETRKEVEETRARSETLAAEQAEAARAAVDELRERTAQQTTAQMEAARREVEELLAEARDQCRAMVDEAQGLRARVLADLARRRKVLHAQIEQLRAGRERLTETVQGVRRSIEGIAEDLFAAEDNARLAAEEAGRALAARAEESTAEEEEMAAVLVSEEVSSGGTSEASAEPVGDRRASEARESAAVVSITAEVGETDRGEAAEPSGESLPGTTEEDTSVDALFARIRAEREQREMAGSASRAPGSVETTGTASENGAGGEAAASSEAPGEGQPGRTAEAAPAEPEEVSEAGEGSPEQPPEERNPAAVRRDELIEPIVTALSRRLKRILQDSQNDLLDRLRSSGAGWSSELLPDQTEAIDSFATAALPALEEAAEAGVAFVGSEQVHGPRADVLIGIADELAESVVGPLRRRLTDDESLSGTDEAAAIEHVGSAFREWKGERIERLSGDHVVAAFSAGTMAAIEAEPAQLEWVAVAGSGDAPCPDCEDNGLSGSQEPGQEFPTGHQRPPAHPGCRCLLSRSAP